MRSFIDGLKNTVAGSWSNRATEELRKEFRRLGILTKVKSENSLNAVSDDLRKIDPIIFQLEEMQRHRRTRKNLLALAVQPAVGNG